MFLWPHGGKIIFLEFLGFEMQIESRQNTVSTPVLKLVPIDTVGVPISTPQCSTRFPFLVCFGPFFGHFLGRDLYFDIFKTFIPNKINFNLINKSLKE